METNSKIIIGITGSLGSGCSSTAKHLSENGFKYFSISRDFLEPLAKEKNEPFETYEDKQNFGNKARRELREEYKQKFLKAIEDSGEKSVVIECFRNPIEIDFLRDLYPHFYLIALFANEEVRKNRKIGEKINERDFKRLDKRDVGEDDKLGQQVRKCVNNADTVLNNSANWDTIDIRDAFFTNIDNYVKLFTEPFRPPTPEETLMHLAYSISLESTCIQRQVGAVIADEKNRVISTGYNNTPPKSLSCYVRYSECFRRKKKREHIDNIKNNKMKYCFNCGKKLDVSSLSSRDNKFNCNSCGEDFLELIPWKGLDYCRSLHAEENAILSKPYLLDDSRKFTIFSTTFPCMLCAKKIATSGIKKVVFVEPYPVQEAEEILKENNVDIEPFEGVKSLRFNWIFRKRGKFLKDSAIKRKIN